MTFGLNPEELKLLMDLVIKPLKSYGASVWIFGSRARGNFKPFSDIDLLYSLDNDHQLPQGALFQIKDAIEESRLPYKVDIVSESELAASYRDNVLSERVLI